MKRRRAGPPKWACAFLWPSACSLQPVACSLPQNASRRLVKQRFLAKGVASRSRCILVGCAAVDGSRVARCRPNRLRRNSPHSSQVVLAEE